MCKTVFITGASKGIGRACALKFLKLGWNVVASMRSPENEKELLKYANALIVKLDVTDASSIHSAVEMAIERFGQILYACLPHTVYEKLMKMTMQK